MTSLINNHKLNYLPEIFSVDELRMLFKFLKKAAQKKSWSPYRDWARLRNYVIITLMYELALRPNEARAIKLQEIDFKNKKVIINGQNNKLRKGRIMPLDDLLIKTLKFYLAHPKTKKHMCDGYIFPTYNNKKIGKHAWQEIFLGIMKASGIYRPPTRNTHGHLSSYSLRHSRATYLYLATKDIFFVANFLGHRSLQSTMVYIHLSKVITGYYDRMRNVMEAVTERQKIHAYPF